MGSHQPRCEDMHAEHADKEDRTPDTPASPAPGAGMAVAVPQHIGLSQQGMPAARHAANKCLGDASLEHWQAAEAEPTISNRRGGEQTRPDRTQLGVLWVSYF